MNVTRAFISNDAALMETTITGITDREETIHNLILYACDLNMK